MTGAGRDQLRTMALVERYQTHSQRAAQRSASSPAVACSEPVAAQPTLAGPRPPRTCISLAQSAVRAKHVGILAMEVYFPAVYVRPLPSGGLCNAGPKDVQLRVFQEDFLLLPS